MMTGTVVLLLIALAIVAYEFWSLGNPQPGDTISENLWWIRAGWLGASLLGALFFWLAYHIVIDRTPGQGWADALAILIGIAAARWAGPHRVDQ